MPLNIPEAREILAYVTLKAHCVSYCHYCIPEAREILAYVTLKVHCVSYCQTSLLCVRQSVGRKEHGMSKHGR